MKARMAAAPKQPQQPAAQQPQQQQGALQQPAPRQLPQPGQQARLLLVL